MLMVAWSVVRLIYWMLIVPYLIGQVFNFILPKERKTVGTTFVLGLLIYFALFEIISIPCMLHYKWFAFTHCRRIYVVVTSILALIGAFRFDKTLFKLKALSELKTETKIYYGFFIALVLFQIVMSYVYAPFNGDDSFYVANSLAAQQRDSMNRVDANRGVLIDLDIRHALAVITLWIAFIAKSSSVHATIVSHSAVQVLFIPLVYYVYYLIGKVLFKDKKENLPVFMIFVNVIMLFGNVSITTPAAFFLTRTWQGKALLCNIVFPMIFWIFLLMFDDVSKVKEVQGGFKEKLKLTAPLWIMLGLVNMFSGMCSELGIVFSSGLAALFTLVLLFVSKRWTVLVGAFMAVIPNLIYFGIYIMMGGGL